MKRWMKWAARLYPASWRTRYCKEFEGLLDDAELRWTDFWDILREAVGMQMKIWTFWRIAGGFGLLGLAIATVTAMRAPDQYISQAVVHVSSPPEPLKAGARAQERVLQLERRALSQESLTKMIDEGRLYESERTSKSISELVQQMRDRDIRIRMLQNAAGEASAFTVEFRQNDGAKAQWGTRKLLTRFIDDNVSVSQTTQDGSGLTLEVLDPANLPLTPFWPNRPVWISLGVVAGLMAGTIVFAIGKWSSRRSVS